MGVAVATLLVTRLIVFGPAELSELLLAATDLPAAGSPQGSASSGSHSYRQCLWPGGICFTNALCFVPR